MFLILSDTDDDSGSWAYHGLRDLGLEPVLLVSPTELICSTWSAHWVATRQARFEIRLPGGQVLASDDITGVLNRWSDAPAASLDKIVHDDVRYAVEEHGALALSWLASIAPVTVNRANTRGLAGAWRSPAEWAQLAARAGLPVAAQRLSSHMPIARRHDLPTAAVLVLGDNVFGLAMDAEQQRICTDLARLADVELLGIEFRADDDGGLQFVGATTCPDLRIGGTDFLECLYARLSAGVVRAT